MTWKLPKNKAKNISIFQGGERSWLTAEIGSELVGWVCERDFNALTSLLNHYCAESGSKWRHQPKMATPESRIFWLWYGGRSVQMCRSSLQSLVRKWITYETKSFQFKFSSSSPQQCDMFEKLQTYSEHYLMLGHFAEDQFTTLSKIGSILQYQLSSIKCETLHTTAVMEVHTSGVDTSLLVCGWVESMVLSLLQNTNSTQWFFDHVNKPNRQLNLPKRDTGF